MLYLDLGLASLALVVTIYTRSKETCLLFIMCACVSLMTFFDWHETLGVLWYPALSLYFFIFQSFTKSIGIAILYLLMQLLCLVSVWEFYTDQSFIYDNFAIIISVLYLCQIGVSIHGCCNGDYQFGDNRFKFNIVSLDYFKAGV